ncbi:MAG: bifunctional adenosylcobinamide kinase/adenosylcobinamide-phosphate guanylyltransferase [Halanaerobiales bacterium]|nr:bifunctional adenosylcobinamide kinase/adenosylcobinamide-phosphate guanylyltransferase [Halanaerobiales bacterium]
MSNIILILGGARSGKSTSAEKIAKKISKGDVYYLATAEALDQEMEDRINKHKEQRPKEWITFEEPKYIHKPLKEVKNNSTVLIDCLTLLISNLLLESQDNKDQIEQTILQELKKVIEITKKKNLNLIIVSNEVGLGLVPSYELGRIFRDTAGRINQYITKKADKVFFSISGILVDLKEISINNLDL